MQQALDLIPNNPDTVIAFCALVVSGVSILLAALSFRAQRVHDRLSVKPLGDIHFSTVDDHIEISISNTGIGPMLCSNLRVYDKDKRLARSNLRDLLPILQENKEWVQISTSSEFYIAAGGQKTLLRIAAESMSPAYQRYRDRVLATLAQVTLEFEYCDIYNQSMGTLRRESFGH